MSSLWERFDNIATPDEVNDAKAQFAPVPAGEYDAILESLEAAESKEGLPMLKGKFRLTENNRVVFYNQMLQNINYPNMTAVNIAEAVTFLTALKGEEIVFEGLGKLAEEVEGIATGTQHKIKVSYAAKDLDMKFPKLKIVESTDYSEIETGVVDGDIPF